MRYTTYSKYVAGLADQVNLQALLDRLSDFLLQSGFRGMPAWWGEPGDTDGGRTVEIFLGKNPAGLNQVLATLRLDPARKTALIVLNDGIADGRDISWVWDADFEAAAGRFDTVVVSGTRAAEMALRLKYAEWDESTLIVEPDIARALDRALAATPAGRCLSLIPTYTAMLSVRELLARRTGRERFWQ